MEVLSHYSSTTDKNFFQHTLTGDVITGTEKFIVHDNEVKPIENRQGGLNIFV